MTTTPNSSVTEPVASGIGPDLPVGARQPVHELVDAVAARDPDRLAVSGADRSLTYGELVAEAAALTRELLEAGCRPGDRVAVLCEPSSAMIVAVLGVLGASAAYVPLDPAVPRARTMEILADAGVVATVADRRGGDLLGDGGDRPAGLSVVPAAAEGRRHLSEEAAYVIYTSGTTGDPKGVVVSHANLTAATHARHLIYPGRPLFLLVSPLAFDSSVAGIWGTLSAGGHLVVASADQVRDPEPLADLVERHGVTHLLCVPSLYSFLLDVVQRGRPERLRSLRTVIVAGEALTEPLLRRHFETYPAGIELVNEYGPTETTVFASYRRYTEPAPVTIGGPIPGARLYVLDEDGRPVGPDVDGELYIGGAGVSQGYLGRGAATSRAFLPDPFSPVESARMFRTGDIVSWTGRGELRFVGRRDHQVKIRGHRVELGAVESRLRSVPQVKDAVVVPTADHLGLVGFVVLADPVPPEELRAHLADNLPAVMVPGVIHVVAEFPVNANGKLDRARLSEIARRDVPAAPGRADDPSSRVIAAWREVLNREDVPSNVNFFDLGGSSMAMILLQGALERHTGVRPSVVALFRHTTVTEQVALVEAEAGPPDRGEEQQSTAARALALRNARRRRALRSEET
ncbi:non-ribosomal peptide synthetase [Actinoplanes sp. NPDC049599]|uniref:non-ribosomal peptide synthetase n=1 Tax=Actinoplanes sp. NPDC049599 TaxID=3363903 RepID=UPI0037A3C78C